MLSACAPEADRNAAANEGAPANEAAPAPAPAAPPATPETAVIPTKFQGLWANTPSACADQKHYSRLVIADRALRYPDFVIIADSVTFPDANEFAVEGKVEGSNRPASAHFSLNKYGDLLRDEGGGGSNRVHCK
jgi:hypothetical protein